MKYLDYAATTFPKPECVLAKMDQVNRTLAVNTGRGAYRNAREAAKIIEEAREKMAAFVHTNSENVIFSPSVTIALNQILRGINWKNNDVVYLSPYEHNAVIRTLYEIQKYCSIEMIPFPIHQKSLEIDIETLKYQFMIKRPTCVCMTHISNITGYILPIEEIARLAKEYQAIVVVDAAQSIGLLPIHLERLKIDFLAFSGHKNLYGPLGIGGFFYLSDYPLQPVLTGGTGTDSKSLQMPKKRPGKYECSSPNISAVAGLLEGVKWSLAHQEELLEKEKYLTRQLLDGLEKIKGVRVYRMPEEKQIGIVSITVEGYQAEEVGMILDEEYGIAVRCGYHCAAYVHEWLKDEAYGGTVRISVGWGSEEEDLKAVIQAIRELAEE